MKIFKVNDRIEIVCRSENTRYGFRHLATLFLDGKEYQDGKCTYQNRTWEAYEFQSVLYEVVRKSDLSEEDKEVCNKWIKEGREDLSGLRSVAMVAKMGELLCDDKKSKNDWKKRMLKAGLGENVSIPEDWDQLSEDEKEARLEGAIKVLSK